MIDREVAMSVILSCWVWEDHITSLPLEEPPASQKKRGGGNFVPLSCFGFKMEDKKCRWREALNL